MWIPDNLCFINFLVSVSNVHTHRCPRRDSAMTFSVSGATELTSTNEYLIWELKRTVKIGNALERTAATLTVLKLCDSESNSDKSEIRV